MAVAAHLPAGTWLEGMAGVWFLKWKAGDFFPFLTTLSCDQSHKGKEKYGKLLFFMPDLLIAYMF